LVFWDFDGVIKDSIMAKSIAFENLFAPYGDEVAARVRQHHESHGGISRFEKIPIYLGWAGETYTPDKSRLFCERFGNAARNAVVKSPWVPGVREYLLNYCKSQNFVLVTATPHDEIMDIVRELELIQCFSRIAGAPQSKPEVIREMLATLGILPYDALLIGDSVTDLTAAQLTGIGFLLRRTALNRELESTSGCLAVDDLRGLLQ
jgi:phosphoglycolate phosphatase-like HAD superfamily hydrolase